MPLDLIAERLSDYTPRDHSRYVGVRAHADAVVSRKALAAGQ